MAQLPIGSCDFSLQNYNYDNVSGDAKLHKFSINHDKENIIPFIKSALSTRKKWTNESLHILASPWSPLGWMKVAESPYCPQFCSNCYLKDEYKQSWAVYFSKFVYAYNVEGIKIWGVTVQSEPEYCPSNYESIHFSPEMQRDFIKEYMGLLLSKEHILIYDHKGSCGGTG